MANPGMFRNAVTHATYSAIVRDADWMEWISEEIERYASLDISPGSATDRLARSLSRELQNEFADSADILNAQRHGVAGSIFASDVLDIGYYEIACVLMDEHGYKPKASRSVRSKPSKGKGRR